MGCRGPRKVGKNSLNSDERIKKITQQKSIKIMDIGNYNLVVLTTPMFPQPHLDAPTDFTGRNEQ